MKKFWISFIALLMGVVIGVGIWHGIAYKDKIKVFADKTWSKIESLFKKDNNKQDEQNPTPNEEQFSLDGLYYLVVDGDTIFVQIKDSKYGTIHGYIQGSKIYLASDWESEIELEPLHITEDEKYLHVFWIDQENGQEDKIAIYDKATKKLYYDFSNGEQLPGKTYEDQLLFEMIKFENFELHEHSFDEIVYSCPPSCNAAGREIRQCLCGKTETVETSLALGHDYVDGKCTRCGEHDPNYVEACEHDWVEDLSYVPTAPSCGEYWDTQYKCSKCNETKLEKNGPLPHEWVDGVCFRCGTQCQHVHENGHICPICGCEVEKKLTWRVGKPATCTENGVEYGDCICGYNSEMREIPALGHDYVNGVCSRCGVQCSHNYYNSLDCSICGHKGTIEISLSDSVLRIEQTNFNNFGYTYCVLVENNESSESFELTTFSGSAGYYWDGVSIDLNDLNLVNFNGQTCSISVFAQSSGVGVVYSNKLEYIVPQSEADSNNVNRVNLSIDSLSDNNFWVLIDAAGVKDYLMNVCPNAQSFTFNLEMVTPVGEVEFTNSKQVSVSDFSYKFGVDKMFMPEVVNDSRYFQITITCDCGSTHKFMTSGVEFNHDGSHYLLTLSA